MNKESHLRANSLHKELDEYIKNSVIKVAYVSAFCFIAVGAFLSLSNVSLTGDVVTKQQTANVLFSDTVDYESEIEFAKLEPANIEQADIQQPEPEPTLIDKPEFNFINDIPDELTNDFTVYFQVENATVEVVGLIDIEHTNRRSLDVQSINGHYQVVVPADIDSGYYELRVRIVPENGSDPQTYSSNIFYSGFEEYFPPEVPEVEDINVDTIIEDVEFYPMDDFDETPQIDKEATESPVLDIPEEINVSENLLPELPQKIESADIEEIKDFQFKLSTEGESILSDTFVVYADLPAEVNFIELYLRPLNSLTENFVTLGNKKSGVWRFVFDTNNFRNGNYELYAKTVLNGRKIKSLPKFINIKNEEPPAPISATSEIKEREAFSEEEITREFFLIEEVVLAESTKQITDNSKVKERFEKMLEENSGEVEELFRNYAVSLQSEDTILSESVKRQIDELQKEISSKSLSDEKAKYYSEDIEELIEDKFVDLQEKITKFEGLRKQRSAGETSKDSDSDGVSDFDEINLYKTDPIDSDTDNDGVLDGVEIVSGYNPLDEDEDVIIDFESPKKTIGLERPDVLVIEEVAPVINVYNEETEEETVRADIRGKALPNSYVTLYIFSSPTVVTVKTDADGSFEYTFDKELEDGQHDVYIAVTDNDGSIIAQSSPFTFIKRAEAFSPVGVDESQIVTQNTIIETTKESYTAVFGIAVLSLGLILLMLGLGLRTRNEEGFVTMETQDNLNQMEV